MANINNGTLAPGSYTYSNRSVGMATIVFIFFTALSFVTFLFNHCAPVAAYFERIGKSEQEQIRKQYPSLANLQHKNEELAIGVVSVFCYEKVFHIIRNLIGTFDPHILFSIYLTIILS